MQFFINLKGKKLNTVLIVIVGISFSVIGFSFGYSSWVYKKLVSEEKKIIIQIQPFDDLPKSYLESVHADLKLVYSASESKKPSPLPETTLNHNKTRYRADLLIKYLSKRTDAGYLTIGLTTKDISTTKGKHQDWGVMGLGYCPGKSCIASSFRLKGHNKVNKLFKVAIHELGHTQGLPHCSVKSCFMRDAEGRDHLDEETEFCPKCRKVLVAAGWSLN
jgi:archaemetzincin